ncbi:MAG: hypothetical protein CL862_05260 [Cyanobium sp. NAT70]|nr:hypothetical protein [Cyanobium sp. NAT70]|tara:strand:- start:3000 stop:3653 length:654 start_codon:yes stop_codon:yes gene_type:complete
MTTDEVPLSRQQALRLIEGAYLAATTGLIWLALYYLPVGGALFRLALPLPLALLQVRRGRRSGSEGLLLAVLLLTALMGPVRGPLLLFPYGLLALWLGWCWSKRVSWWLSWGLGVLLGTTGFLVRVMVMSVLVGENLWVVITRAGAGLLDRLVVLLHLPFSPDLVQVQLMALALVVTQEVIYVLSLHALAFWIFPRLGSALPAPPRLLHGIVALDPL